MSTPTADPMAATPPPRTRRRDDRRDRRRLASAVDSLCSLVELQTVPGDRPGSRARVPLPRRTPSPSAARCSASPSPRQAGGRSSGPSQRPPHRVLVKSANGIGKSWLSAFAAVWFYLTRDPAVVILTAPTARQVVDVTFKEVRRLYGDRPRDPAQGPADPGPRRPPHDRLHRRRRHDVPRGCARTRRSSSSRNAPASASPPGPPPAASSRPGRRASGSGSSTRRIRRATPGSRSSRARGWWWRSRRSSNPNIAAELGRRPAPDPVRRPPGPAQGQHGPVGRLGGRRRGPAAGRRPRTTPPSTTLDEFTPAQAEAVASHFPRRYWPPRPPGRGADPRPLPERVGALGLLRGRVQPRRFAPDRRHPTPTRSSAGATWRGSATTTTTIVFRRGPDGARAAPSATARTPARPPGS